MSILDWFFDRACGDEPIAPPPAPLPAFCNRCGRPLVRESTPTGFDTSTGQRTFRNWLHCPKYKGDWLTEPGTPAGQVAMEIAADWTAYRFGGYPMYFRSAYGDVTFINCKKIKPQPEAVA